MPTAIRICGTASSTSAARESDRVDEAAEEAGDQADDRGRSAPRSRTRRSPTKSEVRAPYIVRTKRSRPAASAPNQNCAVRPLRNAVVVGHLAVASWFCGWPVMFSASGPPKIAIRMSSDDHDSAGEREPCPGGSAPRRAATGSCVRSQRRAERNCAARGHLEIRWVRHPLPQSVYTAELSVRRY